MRPSQDHCWYWCCWYDIYIDIDIDMLFIGFLHYAHFREDLPKKILLSMAQIGVRGTEGLVRIFCFCPLRAWPNRGEAFLILAVWPDNKEWRWTAFMGRNIKVLFLCHGSILVLLAPLICGLLTVCLLSSFGPSCPALPCLWANKTVLLALGFLACKLLALCFLTCSCWFFFSRDSIKSDCDYSFSRSESRNYDPIHVCHHSGM